MADNKGSGTVRQRYCKAVPTSSWELVPTQTWPGTVCVHYVGGGAPPYLRQSEKVIKKPCIAIK